MDSGTTLDLMNRYATYTALFFLNINVLLCSINRRKLNPSLLRWLYFLLWTLIIEILAFIFMHKGYNNLPLLHIYTLGEFILISYFYKSLIHKPSLFQKVFWHFTLIFSVLIILNSIFFQSIFTFNTFAKTFVQLLVIGYAVLYFYNLIENQLFPEIISKSLRLVNSAIIIYYSGSLFIFMFNQIYIDRTDIYTLFWVFNSTIYLVFQLLILVALWKVFYKKKVL